MKNNVKTELSHETPSSKTICIIIFLLPLIFYWKIWILGEIPGVGDVPLQFEPWKFYTALSLEEGRIPLWNPYSACGTPFMANLQSAVFYPVDFLLTLISPAAVFGLGLIVHAWIAGFGMFLFTRLWKIPPWGCCVASIAWMFNGFIMIHIFAGNQLTVTTTAWIPFVFWGVTGYILAWKKNNKNKFVWILISGFLMSMEFLSGHPQMTFYTGCFLIIWSVGLLIEERLVHQWLKICGGFALMIIFAAGLSGIQLIPTLEYIGFSGREGRLDFMSATEFTFAPARLITLIFPEFFGTHALGNYWGKWYEWSQAYMGEICIILIFVYFIFSLRNKNESEIKFPIKTILVATAIAFLFSCGRTSLLYKFLFHTTPLGNFRAPAKFLPFFMLFLLIISAYGTKFIGIRKPGKVKELFWTSLMISGIIIELVLNTNLSSIGSSLAIIGCSGIVISMGNCNRTKYGIIIILMMDLMGFGGKYLKFEKSGETPIYKTLTEITWMKSQNIKPFRVATAPDIPFPNWFMAWGVENASNYDPMSIGEYMGWINRINGKEPGDFVDSISVPDSDSVFIDLCNVKYWISRETPPKNIGPLVYGGSAFNIYLNNNYLPRIWSVNKVESGDIKNIEKFNPKEVAFVSTNIEPKEYNSEINKLEIKCLNPENWEINYTASDKGYLVWSSVWYPGWVAEFPDGNRKKLEKVDSCFSGIEIPAGKNKIYFRYIPKSFKFGKFITIMTILLYFMFIIIIYLFKLQGIKANKNNNILT